MSSRDYILSLYNDFWDHQRSLSKNPWSPEGGYEILFIKIIRVKII